MRDELAVIPPNALPKPTPPNFTRLATPLRWARRGCLHVLGLSGLALAFLFVSHTPSAAVANGKLQLHFMHVGQGDGALLVSPQGETVLFDNGKRTKCDLPISYLQQLGVTTIDYHIASHYHDDRIGCAGEVFTEFPLQNTAYDRGGSYASPAFNAYVTAVGTHRKKATRHTTITLDRGARALLPTPRWIACAGTSSSRSSRGRRTSRSPAPMAMRRCSPRSRMGQPRRHRRPGVTSGASARRCTTWLSAPTSLTSARGIWRRERHPPTGKRFHQDCPK